MGCIVALKDSGSIYLASDSLITAKYGSIEANEPKFSMVNGDDKLVWFGYTGNPRFFQIAKNVPMDYEIEHLKSGVIKWTIALRTSVPIDFKYECMVVGNSSIFTFDQDGFVIEHTGSHFAIGSGAQYALGALDAMTDDASPLSIVKIVLDIVIDRDITSGGSVHTQIV